MVYTGAILFGSDAMTPFRSKMNRYFFNRRDKGIKNLMLYVAVGNVIVYVLTLLNTSTPFFFNLLRFDFYGLFSGQVWRLISYPLCYLTEMTHPLLGLISLYFFYWCGSVLEQYWGTLRSNFYYLCGIVLTDLAAILIGLVGRAEFGSFGAMLAGTIGAEFVNMSLLLAVATLLPEQPIHIWFVIPVKMKWLAWLDVGLTVYRMIDTALMMIRVRAFYFTLFLGLLVPLVAIVNYLLFFGKDAAAILPDFIRYRPTRKSWKRAAKQGQVYDVGTVRRPAGTSGAGRGDKARFRCTVCGRTELSNPGLEFRYCSKCAGYRCYCEDHIQNHAHITEDK